MGKRAATMTLTLKGDSVYGSWQVAPDSSGPAPAPVKLSGVRTGTRVALRAEPVERTVRMNDDEQRVKMVTTYALELARRLARWREQGLCARWFVREQRPAVLGQACQSDVTAM